MINSINMENGRERIDAVVPHAVRHGAALRRAHDRRGRAWRRRPSASSRSRAAIHDICVGEYGLATRAT